MEEELWLSEERYRNLVENSKDSIVILDLKGNVVFGNKATEELTGYSVEEGAGMNVRDITPLRYWPRSLKMLLKARTGKPIPYFESAIKRKDGQLVPVESGGQAILQDGKVVGIQIITRDITERKRADEATRGRAEELAALQATVLDITGPHDLPTLLKTVVERAARLVGASSGGMYLCDPGKQEARCVVSYNTPHDYTGATLKYGEGAAGIVAQTGEPLIVDDYRTWQGRAGAFEEERPFGALLTVPMIWQGRVTGVIHVLDDTASRRFTQADQELLTLFANHAAIAVENTRLLEQEKRHAEELTRYSTSLEQLVAQRTSALQASEKKYRSLVENIPDVTWTTDSEGHTLFISPNVARVYGYTPEEIYEAGAALWFLRIHPDDAPRVKEAFESLFTTGKIYDVEYRIRRKDENWIWLHDRAVAAYEKGGVQYADGVFSDITEHRRMEEKLHKSERLAVIGELAAMVGHDLRNPLQGMVSTVYLAKRKLESTLESHGEDAVKRDLVDMLETIENESQYMDKIVSDLQNYASPLKTEPKLVELEPLVKDTLSKIRVPQNVKVSFKVSEPLPAVMIDHVVMRRVFSNLIMNAIQAMPDGGELTIDLSRTEERLLVSFRDTGVGIPEENMDKLFNPFFTTKAKGQGLGLPACKRLVEAHDGRITVESKLGEGSTFTVRLPIIKS